MSSEEIECIRAFFGGEHEARLQILRHSLSDLDISEMNRMNLSNFVLGGYLARLDFKRPSDRAKVPPKARICLVLVERDRGKALKQKEEAELVYMDGSYVY